MSEASYREEIGKPKVGKTGAQRMSRFRLAREQSASSLSLTLSLRDPFSVPVFPPEKFKCPFPSSLVESNFWFVFTFFTISNFKRISLDKLEWLKLEYQRFFSITLLEILIRVYYSKILQRLYTELNSYQWMYFIEVISTC